MWKLQRNENGQKLYSWSYFFFVAATMMLALGIGLAMTSEKRTEQTENRAYRILREYDVQRAEKEFPRAAERAKRPAVRPSTKKQHPVAPPPPLGGGGAVLYLA